MKFLSLLTLTLHFFAVQLLIGSLVAVIVFSVRAKGNGKDPFRDSATAVGRRLPIIMTYVINLGIPPLLFAQVLYGRALYTSSILIGAMWISVILLLAVCYWLLYRVSEGAQAGRAVHWQALYALILAGIVGHIYATNMTLMLRPEVWQAMYAKTATGTQIPPADSTTEPRLFFVLVGGLLVTGFWLTLHSNLKDLAPEASALLRRAGAGLAAAGAIGELGAGYWVVAVQPASVAAGLGAPLCRAGEAAWAIGFGLALLIALYQLATRSGGTAVSVLGCVTALVGIAGAVIVRDGIRDVTLLQKGFDVWNRREASNWYVIGLFLLLFVVGVGAVGWLLSVMRSAKPVSEQVSY